jgi:hypothetical protein
MAYSYVDEDTPIGKGNSVIDVISAVSPFFPHISAYYSEPPTRESAPHRAHWFACAETLI